MGFGGPILLLASPKEMTTWASQRRGEPAPQRRRQRHPCPLPPPRADGAGPVLFSAAPAPCNPPSCGARCSEKLRPAYRLACCEELLAWSRQTTRASGVAALLPWFLPESMMVGDHFPFEY
ncbi:hypothetical protein BS78_05G184900 [Paspalum vaginatum]|nr:hypothetical protein BS78_05G184900 [Paspalum vaginatum]